MILLNRPPSIQKSRPLFRWKPPHTILSVFVKLTQPSTTRRQHSRSRKPEGAKRLIDLDILDQHDDIAAPLKKYKRLLFLMYVRQ